MLSIVILVTFLAKFLVDANTSCVPRDYGKGGTVCVCNSTHCDTLDVISKTSPGIVSLFVSDKNGDRFKRQTLQFPNKSESNPRSDALYLENTGKTVTINRDVKYQKIIGFGGAFTDAAGINIASLGPALAQQIIKDYYSPYGLSYSMGRIPMAGSDFSTRKYTYDDNENDLQLEKFQLTEEDIKFKIPFIKLAKNVSSHNVKLFGSPWSAPKWMKTNNDLAGKGTLKGEPGGQYYKAWAKYFVKFLDSYKSNGLDLWGLTAQNEPYDGQIESFPFNCLGFTAELQRDFISKDLGPALEAAGYGPNKLKLMIIDDQRLFLNQWANVILKDNITAKYVSGIAFHWYLNTVTSPTELDKIQNQFPDYFLLSTEACEGSNPFQKDKVSLGDWGRAQSYAYDIITDLQHYTTGWVDWNLALDENGGPNWSNNFVDAPIIVNKTAKEYYKQPMFYSLAHFSKFLMPDSQRIGSKDEGVKDLETIVFQTPDNATVLIALNRLNDTIPLTIIDPKLGSLKTSVPAFSIQTYFWYY